MRRIFVVVAMPALLAAGCGRPARELLVAPEPPIVWPVAPDEPRVRYVGQLTGSDEIGAKKSFAETWDELLYGPKPPAKMVTPQAVAVNGAGNQVAVADVNGKCVHLFDLRARTYLALIDVGLPLPGDKRAASWAKGDKRPPVVISMECPVAVCWVGESIWVADAKLHAVAIFEPNGASRWTGGEKFKRPAGMAYCPANQLCYVSDAGAHCVLAFDMKGVMVASFGSHGSGPGQFNGPSHLACSGETLVVADSLNFRVQRLKLDGSPINQFGRKGDAAGDMALPKGVAVDAAGSIWVVDAHFENVQAFTPEGQLLMSLGQEGSRPGEFSLPAGVCIDGQKRMWVADTYNHRVQVFSLLQ